MEEYPLATAIVEVAQIMQPLSGIDYFTTTAGPRTTRAHTTYTERTQHALTMYTTHDDRTQHNTTPVTYILIMYTQYTERDRK